MASRLGSRGGGVGGKAWARVRLARAGAGTAIDLRVESNVSQVCTDLRAYPVRGMALQKPGLYGRRVWWCNQMKRTA